MKRHRMAPTSTPSDSSPANSRIVSIKEEPGTNCSSSGKAECLYHLMNCSNRSAHGSEIQTDTNNPDMMTVLCSTFPAGTPKAVKVTDHCNSDLQRNRNSKNYRVGDHESADKVLSAGGPEKKEEKEEPVSLRKTSSLLRQVQRLREDHDLCLEGNSNDSEEDTTSGITVPKTQEDDGEEGFTYHVLDTSTIVKLEPERKGSLKSSAADVDCFDGHTITLVEDENNAGTFKIAEIGDDNMLRVIDNNQIVVFQDGATINELRKTSVNGKSKTREEGSSCLPQSVNAVHADDGIIISEACPSSKVVNTKEESAHQEDEREVVGLKRSKRCSESNMDDCGEQAIRPYADSRILKPQHSEAGIQQHNSKNGDDPYSKPSTPVQGNSQLQSWHYPSERESSVSTHSRFKGSETHYSSQASNYGQSTTSSSSSNQQASADYDVNKASSGSSTSAHGSYAAESSAVYQGYPGLHPVGTWPASGQGSSSDHGEVILHPMSEGATNRMPGTTDTGHAHTGGYATSVHGPPAAVGAPHQHPSQSYMVPGVSSASNSYTGYSVDAGHPWRTVKMNEGGHADMQGAPQSARDALVRYPTHHPPHQPLQHPQCRPSNHTSLHYSQEQQHQPPAHQYQPPIPASVVRPYPMYPGWEGGLQPPQAHHQHPSHQQHLRYMTSAAVHNDRSSARIHQKSQMNSSAFVGQSVPTPLININNTVDHCPPHPTITTSMAGKTRKRSASQMDSATVSASSKGDFKEVGSNTTVLAGSSASTAAGSSGSSSSSLKESDRKKTRIDTQQTTVSITNLGTVSSNVHTLKPCHIIAWYIDYLILENEDRTQISRAFTLPVNLFHTDDFYFLDSLRKKVRFPSPKFLAWMQYHLPSLNASAIDFWEGRPKCRDASSGGTQAPGGGGPWNQQQDWSWQNKTKRDIIHDVFFYFQQRKAKNMERHQYVSSGARTKAQKVA